MRLLFALGWVGVFALPAVTHAFPTVRSSESAGPEDRPRFEVVSAREGGLTLTFDLPSVQIDEVNLGVQRFQSIEIPGGGLVGEVGEPALPTFARFVAIPDDAAVRVRAFALQSDEMREILVAPMQSEIEDRFDYNADVYAQDLWTERTLAAAGDPVILRDLRVVPLTVQPFRYNAAQRTLEVAERIQIEITFEGTDVRNVREDKRTSLPPSFHRLYEQTVINYTEAPRGMEVQPGSYLLICPDDNAVTSRLQPLIDWRRRQGYSVVVATTAQTGTTNTQIKNYIQNAYNTWSPPLEYIVLAGDATTPYRIPTWNEGLSGYNGEGDHPYTQLQGNDVLSDAFIGRLSFGTTAELETIVAKIVGYETTPLLSDPNWFTRASLVGDPSTSGYSTVIVQQWIKRRLRQMGYAQIDTIYSSPFVSQMTTSLNRGPSIFSYRGYYGMSGWTNSNTNALSNGWKLPFVVTITCDTGSFAGGTARSEQFLRAGTATTPKAGIGAIGMATIGTHTRFNNCMHYGIFYGLLYEGQHKLGAAQARGKLEMFLNYGSAQPNYVTIWSYWANLMGDPAVDCWTGYPEAMNVSYPSSLPIGANSVTVRVLDGGGRPTQSAQVCLSKGSETYVVGQTDALGQVELPMSLITAGNMLVTVTKHNYYPHLGSIPVTGATRFVAYVASTLDDDAIGASVGNGDALLNPGETIELNVQVKNFGSQPVSGVTGILTENDPYVTISQGATSFGNIAANGTAWSATRFVFSLGRDCPHGRLIRFGLDISAGTETWHSLIDIGAVSADLSVEGYTLYNVGGNNRLDPGETGQLSIKLRNLGGAPATTPVVATLHSLSQYVTITDSGGTFGTIGAGLALENTSDTFALSVAPECYNGYNANFRAVVEFSGGTRDTTTFALPIGLRTAADPTGPCAYGYLAYDNTDAQYPQRPTYNWIEIDPAFGGSGTEIVLGDTAPYQDKSRVVDLPFPFQYYGRTYTKATVCSNGWLCMGSTWTAEYRNWTIPGAGGPEAMIAPFWDDLYQVAGSKVLQFYDVPNKRWIVEWSRMRNDVGGHVETFEVILYDPAHHPTATGDGIIEFMYNTVTNSDPTDGYATVGIENHDQSVGVLYTYFNLYTPGSATLTAGRAIRFVPTREVLTGRITGLVRNDYAGGIPVAGATVTVMNTGETFTSGPDGSYEAVEPPGTYSLRASREGFAPDTVTSVVVNPGGVVQVNFNLRDIVPPVVQTTPAETTNDTIGPYPVFVSISDPSPLAERSLFYRVNGGTFLRLSLLNLGQGIFRSNIPGQPWSTKVEYYIRVRDVGDNLTLDPPGAPDNLFVFYVAPTVSLFADDMEIDRGWTVGAPDDTATEGIWVRVDPNGTYNGGDPVQPEDDHTPGGGTNCWVTGNAPPGSGQAVEDVDNGKTTLTSPMIFLNREGEATLRYYRWFTNDTGTSPGEDPWVVQISSNNGATWIDLENTTQSDRSWRLMEFDLADYITFTDEVRIRFIAADYGDASIVEAAIDDLEILFTGLGQNPASAEASEIPVFGLLQNRPNPFNPRTNISFSLEADGRVQLIVYDVQGRLVRKLVNGVLPAGHRSVDWDGRDEDGRRVASGIYLYRLDAGSQSLTRKMILLQ